MKPVFHCRLINPPEGDPGILVEFQFERRALLFDLGDNTPLSTRTLLAVTHAFVSHTHMDHFVGFDRLLRVLVGREKHLHLFGPAGFIDQVGHKLAAYTWNLVHNYAADLTLTATEVIAPDRARFATFHSRDGFGVRDTGGMRLDRGVLVDEPQFAVRFAILDHRIPSLAFALEEKRHVNIWKNRLTERGLLVGPWLHDLKQAIADDRPDASPIRAASQEGERSLTLGELKRDIVHIEAGQKVAYVTDTAGYEANAQRIVGLVRGADLLFIETPFLEADAGVAQAKYHLTAARAGELARQAGVGRLVPFHYSARYRDGKPLEQEAQAALRGQPDF